MPWAWRKGVKRMLVAILVLVAVAVGGSLIALAVWSVPGTPAPIVDDQGRLVPGSLSEKRWVELNGAPQGLILRGRDATKPVLLFIHGGLPEYFLAERFARGLEALFVVCWWDQRGAGLSYRPERAGERITSELLVADALEVTKYLQQRFQKDRIYVMAHSGGTFLAMQLLAKAPERFHAYVGEAQMANQLRSEKEAYDFLLAEYRRLGDRAMVERLERAPVTAERIPPEYLRVRDQAMHRLGVGTTHAMRSVVTGLFLPSLQSRSFTLAEKVNLWRGKRASGVSAVWDEMTATDLPTLVPRVDVPVYFFHGAYDRTCSLREARAYFDKLEAPKKRFFLFGRSAHSPVFEEPERAMELLRTEVLPN